MISELDPKSIHCNNLFYKLFHLEVATLAIDAFSRYSDFVPAITNSQDDERKPQLHPLVQIATRSNATLIPGGRRVVSRRNRMHSLSFVE